MRKLVDEYEQQSEEFSIHRLATNTVYDVIRRSNSSLSRRPKRLLEDSIDRILDIMRDDAEDAEESEHVEGDFQGIEENVVRFSLCHSRHRKTACYVS